MLQVLPTPCCSGGFHEQLKHQHLLLFFRELLGSFGWKSSLPYLSPAEGQEDGCSPPSSFCMLQQERTLHCEYLRRVNSLNIQLTELGGARSQSAPSQPAGCQTFPSLAVLPQKQSIGTVFLQRQQLVLLRCCVSTATSQSIRAVLPWLTTRIQAPQLLTPESFK